MHPSQADKNVFGADVKLHPVTHMPLETGRGALSDHHQAAEHCNHIERAGDKQRADELRHELGIPTSEEIAAKAAADAEHHAKHAGLVEELHERVKALEAKFEELAKA